MCPVVRATYFAPYLVWRHSYGSLIPSHQASPIQSLGLITKLRSSSCLDAARGANQIVSATAHAFDVIAGQPIKPSVNGLDSNSDKVHLFFESSILTTRAADVFR
jgi:hypothetical protein